MSRFYYHFTETNSDFKSAHKSGWQVFDREVLDKQGACEAVALCRSRAVAITIVESLILKQAIGDLTAASATKCSTCDGRGYLVEDSEWEPVSVQCPACRSSKMTAA